MDCAVKFLLRSESILDENKKKMLEFKQHCVASGLSVARQLYYLQRLTRIAEKIEKKRFEDCGKADIEALMEYVNTAKTESGKPWSGWNRAAYALTNKTHLREHRGKAGFRIVALTGYTQSGKTPCSTGSRQNQRK